MESGQQLQRSQSLIPQDGLQKMGKELLRLCDSIERHGLVDYQYGVWEEQIIDSKWWPLVPRLDVWADSFVLVLEECLDLYETPSSSGGNGDGGSNSRRR